MRVPRCFFFFHHFLLFLLRSEGGGVAACAAYASRYAMRYQKIVNGGYAVGVPVYLHRLMAWNVCGQGRVCV